GGRVRGRRPDHRVVPRTRRRRRTGRGAGQQPGRGTDHRRTFRGSRHRAGDRGAVGVKGADVTVDNDTTERTGATGTEQSGEGRTSLAGDQRATTLAGASRDWLDRVRGGDMGALPAFLGLAVLFVVFTLLRPESFTSELNIANLFTQAAPI